MTSPPLNPRHRSTPQVLVALFNTLAKALDVRGELISVEIYSEQTLRNPGSLEERREELKRVTSLDEIGPNTRVFLRCTIKSHEKLVPFLATLLFDSDMQATVESEAVLEVPDTTQEQYEKGPPWRDPWEVASAAGGIIWRLLEYVIQNLPS